jgi:hypothetical protein
VQPPASNPQSPTPNLLLFSACFAFSAGDFLNPLNIQIFVRSTWKLWICGIMRL